MNYWGEELVGTIPAESAVLGGGAPVYHKNGLNLRMQVQAIQRESIAQPSDLKVVAKQMVALPFA